MFIVYRIFSLLIYTSYHHNFGNSLHDIKIKLNTNLRCVTQVECKEGDSKYDCANCDRQEESNFQGGHSPFFHIQCLCHFHPAPLWINNFEGLKPYPGQQHDVGDEGKKHWDDVAENPNLKRCEPTVVVGSVPHHRVEDADLAEKDCDQGEVLEIANCDNNGQVTKDI